MARLCTFDHERSHNKLMEHPSTQICDLPAMKAKKIGGASSQDERLNDLLDKLVCMLAKRVACGYAEEQSNDGAR